MEFTNFKGDNARMGFQLRNTHVSYANTLRRLILTGVEMVGFRADMTSAGTTTDVDVQTNDTPMTNEMLAHRIGLLPIMEKEPKKWNPDKYIFRLEVEGEDEAVKDITATDFEIYEVQSGGSEPVKIPTGRFFPPNKITGSTCLIATLMPSVGGIRQKIKLIAKATVGTGRENARFIPTSQCTYEYTRDTDQERIDDIFMKWVISNKKAPGVNLMKDRVNSDDKDELDREKQEYKTLMKEFNTMEIARCYLMDEKGEPYSFDFIVESTGILDATYIIKTACEVGEAMCARYVHIDMGELPEDVSVSPADCQMVGFDFIFRNHDYTLGNLLQTWLVQNHIEGNAEPKITFAGMKIPHPLRDEMLLRIGADTEDIARKAIAAACRGCTEMFRQMKLSFMKGLSEAVSSK